MEKRTLVFYEDYFKEFYSRLEIKVQTKVLWTLKLIAELERIPETYLKHLTNTRGLYEIRQAYYEEKESDSTR